MLESPFNCNEPIKVIVGDNKMYCTEFGGQERKFCTLRQSRLKDTKFSKVSRRFKKNEPYDATIVTLWDEPRSGYCGIVRIL